MISAMNTDNLSCAFYSYNLVNKLLPSVTGQRDTPMDKRAILWTKGYSEDKRSVPKNILTYIGDRYII